MFFVGNRKSFFYKNKVIFFVLKIIIFFSRFNGKWGLSGDDYR